MKLRWFDTGEVDRFAEWVVAQVVQRLPPATLGIPERKLGERIRRMNDWVSAHAAELAVRERPNFYQRARLASRVKWGLREAGYPEAFVETFTYEFATLVTLAARRAPRP
jgi:hypothetical protein